MDSTMTEQPEAPEIPGTVGYVYICHEKTGPGYVGDVAAPYGVDVTDVIYGMILDEDSDCHIETVTMPDAADVIYEGWGEGVGEIEKCGPVSPSGHRVGVAWAAQNDDS